MDSDIDMLDIATDEVKSYEKVVIDKANILKIWREKMNKGELTTKCFKEFWRNTVPAMRMLQPNHINPDDSKSNGIFFQYLEEFIFGGDPQHILPNLSKLDNPPSVCGRVFKMGEPTYSCRECGMDPTCVLCVDCFKQSAHRNHKYKMGTSNGGGCCDCGDKEAWKREPFCDIHIIGALAETTKVSRLPPDILARMRITLEAILWYCYNLLTLEHVPGLPADLVPTLPTNTNTQSMALYETPDTYCTVLYNDETHTFEQVIHTLIRVIQCSQKDAIEFVTNIDREGRAVVKCATFQTCDVLKTEIERYTARHASVPLKVLVMHSDVISHQVHALKMLSWLQGFLGQLEGLRLIFSEVALNESADGSSIIEGILQRDYYLWKAARSSWHRLFISGMLLEYESKKALATVFTKNYGAVMKDFIKDDHDPSFSISSLSVQIFTVPTLAHYLIADQEVLFILMNTFLSECSQKCNNEGKLLFVRPRQNNQSNTQNNQNMLTFKRAQYILYDLRYLLSAKPEVWTEGLRKGFLAGVSQVLKLFTCMQGMDAVVRQMGHHVDYEPEWESAFNLHIKLAHIITLILEWCSTDMSVLLNAYRCTLKKLVLNMDTKATNVVQELVEHSATCLVYDISTQPVSIHLPLSRFLAGLHLHLEKYNLNFYSDKLSLATSSIQPEHIIEPVLRTQALIAQVNAGMWRRNGYSLLNQVFFYHNVKCRTEMLDRDIVLLQIGATLIESNEFLIHILHKFNLLNWVNSSFESKNNTRNSEDDSMRQTINLAEEFLGLLITIIGERYIPGISDCSNDDRIKKEIIQQLCIKPMPHSELNRTLPDDIHHETGLENVINEVANFKKPQQSVGKGIYELKLEYYDDYNVFFYHYTREELSLSEETQRSRRKAAGLLECCPPPKLLKLKDSFSILSNLLQCDVMLHIMQTVLSRSIDLRARSFSETQLHKVVHLIGYALHEEESKNYPYFNFTARALKWRILPSLEQLVNSSRVEIHKDLLAWTIQKYKEVAVVPASTEEVSQNLDSNTSSETDSKAWRSKMVAQRRAKVMAHMASLQTNFMKKNADIFVTGPDSTSISQGPTESSITDITTHPVCLGPKQTARSVEQQSYTCILCQEDSLVSVDGPTLVLSAFVQQSTVLFQHRTLDPSLMMKDNPYFLGAALGPAPHTSTCGHVMHSSCWNNQMKAISTSEARRPYRLRQLSSYDVDKKEFLCPLCESLTNTILPLVPPLSTMQSNNVIIADISFTDWLKSIQHILSMRVGVTNKSLNKEDLWHEINNIPSQEDGDNAFGELRALSSQTTHIPTFETAITGLGDIGKIFEKLYPTSSEINFCTEFCEEIKKFAKANTFKELDQKFNEPIMSFKTCTYTILSLEMILRESNKSLLGDLSSRQRDCVRSLVRLCGVLCQIYLLPGNYASLLLSVILENTGPCILEWDTFGLLVPLTFTMPSLFSSNKQVAIASGGTQDHHILSLLFLSHIVKILITLDVDGSNMEVDCAENTNTELSKFTAMIKTLSKTGAVLNENALEDKLKNACLPFLRCCAIFYHFLTDVAVPSNLAKSLGDYDDLCNYLGLESDIQKLVSCEYAQNLALKWCSHKNLAIRLRPEMRASLVIQPIKLPQLVDLPTDYSELINAVSLFTCPNSDRDDSRNPTMCLVCGLMLCSQSYCCQTELEKSPVGACTYHSQICGAGAGVFLRVRECEVLLLSAHSRGCFMSPPYLDEYGETDQGLRRGNPLALCMEKFRELQIIWLGHSIHEVISRAIESNTNLATVATQWQHL